MPPALEVRLLSPRWESALAKFFQSLEESGVTKFFHPHSFDRRSAHQIAHADGLDIYYVLVEGNRVLGYGMLRGWDAGYEVPSIGLALDEALRGLGIGETFMRILHHAAALRGAQRVRLSVYESNIAAVNLYHKLGYKFEKHSNDGQLLGYIELNASIASE